MLTTSIVTGACEFSSCRHCFLPPSRDSLLLSTSIRLRANDSVKPLVGGRPYPRMPPAFGRTTLTDMQGQGVLGRNGSAAAASKVKVARSISR